jgi:hypothetical protein
MQRMKKALFLQVWRLAWHWKNMRLLYWADRNLYELRSVYIMPCWYYLWLYRTCMRLAASGTCLRMADRAIHTIPYHIRFEMA